jgi:hypothetical protein
MYETTSVSSVAPISARSAALRNRGEKRSASTPRDQTAVRVHFVDDRLRGAVRAQPRIVEPAEVLPARTREPAKPVVPGIGGEARVIARHERHAQRTRRCAARETDAELGCRMHQCGRERGEIAPHARRTRPCHAELRIRPERRTAVARDVRRADNRVWRCIGRRVGRCEHLHRAAALDDGVRQTRERARDTIHLWRIRVAEQREAKSGGVHARAPHSV